MRLTQFSSIVVACVLGPCILPAQSDPCDRNLLQPVSNPYGYRLRGERCEGIYVQPVGATSLVIASWTESFADYNLASQQPLLVDWDSPGNIGTVRVRAQGVRRRLYYRMDAVCSPRAAPFTWPSDVLSVLKISKSDVGVTGIARTSVAGAERDLYLPVRIRQGAGAPVRGKYRLVLLPGVELKEVFVSLAAIAGNARTVLTDSEPVGYGYYPAERPIEIPISGPRAIGVYQLEIGATRRSAGASTAELWFYHEGSQEPRK